MKCHVIRTAMCGGGLSYDVYVPVADVPAHVLEACPGGTYHTRILRDAGEFLHYEDATISAEHEAMDQGWDRYEAWKLHEVKARQEMLQIAAQAFPELAKVCAKTDKLPTLWVHNLLPEETSAEVVLDIARP